MSPLDDEERKQIAATAFGCLVRDYRSKKGWTQGALAAEAFDNADRAGYVSEIERGKRPNISHGTVANIMRALEIPEHEVPTRLLRIIENEEFDDPHPDASGLPTEANEAFEVQPPKHQNGLFARLREVRDCHPIALPFLVIVAFLSLAVVGVASVRFLQNTPAYYAATVKNSIRLSGEEVEKLLIGNIEVGKIIKPSKEHIEGRPNTWFEARYSKDGTMVYDHADHQYPAEDWLWRIDIDGNLCRGPGVVEPLSCRTIVSVGKNAFYATGLRTGTLRYQFSVRKANQITGSVIAVFAMLGSLSFSALALIWLKSVRRKSVF